MSQFRCRPIILGMACVMSSAAMAAEPVDLTAAQMDRITAGFATIGAPGAASVAAADAFGDFVLTSTTTNTSVTARTPESAPQWPTVVVTTGGTAAATSVGQDATRTTSIDSFVTVPATTPFQSSIDYQGNFGSTQISIRRQMAVSGPGLEGFLKAVERIGAWPSLP
jgi:hypothetical protein